MRGPRFAPQPLPTGVEWRAQPRRGLRRSRHHLKRVRAPSVLRPGAFVGSTDSPDRPLGCGAVLTDLEGSFSSPNHPGSYPPNLLCMWVIQVPAPFVVQIHVLNLAVEGPSPCLFDWLEVQEQMALSSVVIR